MLASLLESVFVLELEIGSFVTFSGKLSEIGFEGRAGICGFGRSETIAGAFRVSVGGATLISPCLIFEGRGGILGFGGIWGLLTSSSEGSTVVTS
jgi:hypothetical protein